MEKGREESENIWTLAAGYRHLANGGVSVIYYHHKGAARMQ